MVDRRHRPGGHWNDDYPFVRLHQPSALYGVLSRTLGHDRIDATGPNSGFYERATAAEICDCYGRVLDEHLVPSGQVRFLGMHDHIGSHGAEHHLRAVLTGADTTVRVRRRLVDATYMESSLPSTHSPPFAVDPDARVVAPNDLVSLPGSPSGFTVIGAGKTSMDTCCWLVDNGVHPDAIRWIRPRDAWTNDRAAIQPRQLVAGFAEWLAAMNEASAAATDLRDMCLRMEDAGVLMRLDPDVEPAFYRGAILSASERATLSTIGHVVRMGRVRHVGATRIELEQGSIPTDASHVHVDCTAAGLACRPNRTVFEQDRITPQWIQNGIAPFNAALTGWVEANRDNDTERNRLCPPNGFTPEADARSLARQWAVTQRAVCDPRLMPSAENRIAVASRHVRAAPGRIFEMIADPARHPEWDGNDNLAEAAHGQRVRSVGDVFSMTLTTGSVRENGGSPLGIECCFAQGRRRQSGSSASASSIERFCAASSTSLGTQSGKGCSWTRWAPVLVCSS